MDIIITGSVAYDYLMRFPGKFKDHILVENLHQVSLSFLVDDMTKHWGGVAANIAYTMALLGLSPRIFATVGRDFGDYRTHLEAAGVDCSLVQQDDAVFTASFFVNTDLDNNQIASFYTGAMANARNFSVGDVVDDVPELVVISPNDPEAMLQLTDECRKRGIKFVADPSQQVPRLNGDELRRSIEGAHLLVVNAYEAGIIGKKMNCTQTELRAMVETLIVTQGADGSHIYDEEGQITVVKAFPTDEIKDPTGAGDAYRGGLLRGLSAGLPLDLSAQMGALCATYTLEHVGTQNHRFSPAEFVARFRTVFDDEGRLDALLP